MKNHIRTPFLLAEPGRVTQSVARLTQEPEVPVRYPVLPHTFVFENSSCQLLAKVYTFSTK